MLRCIPVTTPVVTLDQAKRDFKRERVLFNDVPFIPDKTDVHRCHAFSLTLEKLVQRLVSRTQHGSDSMPSFEVISDIIMQRACRLGLLPRCSHFIILLYSIVSIFCYVINHPTFWPAGPVPEPTVSSWCSDYSARISTQPLSHSALIEMIPP